jgi:hypothetical protein
MFGIFNQRCLKMYEQNRYSRIYRNIIGIILLITLLSFCLFVSVAYGAQTMNSSVNVTQITKNSLTFSVEYKGDIRATGATFDGVEIEGFDLLHTLNYTVSGLEPNTTHQFCIYKDLYNCEIATTSPDNVEYNLEYYITLIIALIAIFIGVKASRFVGFISLICGAYLTMLSFSNLSGVTLLTGIVISLASVFVIFAGRGD